VIKAIVRVGIYRACGIGDAVQLTPLFQQIRADLPDAELVFFTSENVVDLLRHHPALDRVVGFAPAQTIGGASRFGNLPLWHRIRREGPWDFLLNFEPKFRASLAFRWVGARRSSGYVTRWPWLGLYSHPLFVPPLPAPDAPHVSTDYLRAWQNLTGNGDRNCGYNMQHLLQQPATLPELPEEFLCLAPGSGNFAGCIEAKRWPYWRELADLLRAEGWRLAWLGGSDDAREYRPPPGDLNLLGRIDLVTAAHVIGRSAGLIGNDSGMFHLAIGLGVPAAAFYGPTSSTHVGPFRASRSLVLKKDIPCAPCQEYSCRVPSSGFPSGAVRPFCMTLLRPEDVLPRLRSFFQEPKHTAQR